MHPQTDYFEEFVDKKTKSEIYFRIARSLMSKLIWDFGFVLFIAMIKKLQHIFQILSIALERCEFYRYQIHLINL